MAKCVKNQTAVALVSAEVRGLISGSVHWVAGSSIATAVACIPSLAQELSCIMAVATLTAIPDIWSTWRTVVDKEVNVEEYLCHK